MVMYAKPNLVKDVFEGIKNYEKDSILINNQLKSSL